MEHSVRRSRRASLSWIGHCQRSGLLLLRLRFLNTSLPLVGDRQLPMRLDKCRVCRDGILIARRCLRNLSPLKKLVARVQGEVGLLAADRAPREFRARSSTLLATCGTLPLGAPGRFGAIERLVGLAREG